MKGYSVVPVDKMEGNVVDRISNQWMLVTAGDGEKCDTMTASWGGIGFVWGTPAATVYIRPQRYTREFIDARERLTLSFMGEEFRQALTYCGSHSGHNEDKLRALSLRDSRIGDYIVYDEAVLTFACRKIYMREMDERLVLDKSITETYYADKDVHWSFSGLIEHVYI